MRTRSPRLGGARSSGDPAAWRTTTRAPPHRAQLFDSVQHVGQICRVRGAGGDKVRMCCCDARNGRGQPASSGATEGGACREIHERWPSYPRPHGWRAHRAGARRGSPWGSRGHTRGPSHPYPTRRRSDSNRGSACPMSAAAVALVVYVVLGIAVPVLLNVNQAGTIAWGFFATALAVVILLAALFVAQQATTGACRSNGRRICASSMPVSLNGSLAKCFAAKAGPSPRQDATTALTAMLTSEPNDAGLTSSSSASAGPLSLSGSTKSAN